MNYHQYHEFDDSINCKILLVTCNEKGIHNIG